MCTKAMKLALEALENAWLDASMGKGDVARHTEAITALRQAIEQAEQAQPVAKNWRHVIPGMRHTDQWDSARVADYNQGWNDCQKKTKAELEKLCTAPPSQPKPLMGNAGIWVLTSEYNDYDQHGEYFEAVFIGKPTPEQIQNRCEVSEHTAKHILSGEGRRKYEDQWFNLREEVAHIKEKS